MNNFNELLQMKYAFLLVLITNGYCGEIEGSISLIVEIDLYGEGEEEVEADPQNPGEGQTAR